MSKPLPPSQVSNHPLAGLQPVLLRQLSITHPWWFVCLGTGEGRPCSQGACQWAAHVDLQQLRHRRLLGYAGTRACFYGCIFAYITGYGISPPLYGLLFGIAMIDIMLTNQINARLLSRIGSDRLMLQGAMVAAVAVLAIDAKTGRGALPGLVIPLFLIISSTGFIVANAIAGALGIYPEQAGTVSVLTGSIQYGAGTIGSALVGICADQTHGQWEPSSRLAQSLACSAPAL
ncbi:hypothetical protein [Aquitalea sp.]|jgi:hypothetical protein|uniref:hypothetical protein n=1 Tax=Aquitalea sp. TaxID=1872623 RepID=UPI002590D453|nr:hypothetical protein [Aquitalea sp.]